MFFLLDFFNIKVTLQSLLEDFDVYTVVSSAYN